MIVRVQLQFPYDSTLPRDVFSINPHYESSNPVGLLAGLKTNLQNWTPTAGHPVILKAYDALKAPPSYPLAIDQVAGTTPNSGVPRELALCLSYFGGVNRPTFRGRLFLPATWFGVAPAVRPTGAQQDLAGEFAGIIGKNLPNGMWWTVYSRKNRSAAQVTDWWVDDEWDTVRSRGLKPTSRVTGKLP